jgi:hypothetical protein
MACVNQNRRYVSEILAKRNASWDDHDEDLWIGKDIVICPAQALWRHQKTNEVPEDCIFKLEQVVDKC